MVSGSSNGDQMLCLRSSDDFASLEPQLRSVIAGSTSHLDVGCSSGGLMALLKDMYPRLSLCGIDVSEDRLAMARAKIPDAAIVQGDANHPLPFEDGSFDTATCFELLEHLLAPGKLVSELHRVLRQNGLLFLTTPNANALMRIVAKSRWYGLGDPTHLIFFSRFTLRLLLERMGFRVERMWTDSNSGFRLFDAAVRSLGLGGQICVVARKKPQSSAHGAPN